ncbi:hypothetical protein XM38_026160 [Halomicronema hongdechloris C2206]|uniref:Uncharacterized protein n=1 Tax=Halomicronema hongdechloris C2206 TaxID=1641165 RepID=A0A1Z3HMZ6_9CYAN|nr:hypothetical protein [Halomicronema hongdechloris]ASC71662.1 hypothetical protein XM38_026160 [Halomicronema hongdechloris C2206]
MRLIPTEFAVLTVESLQMFNPTHTLVSRRRRLPVALVPGGEGYKIYTEAEWGQDRDPAFELHPKLGVFCRGVQVLGHHLEPINNTEATGLATEAETPTSA